MKKLLLLLVALCGFISCNKDSDNVTSPKTSNVAMQFQIVVNCYVNPNDEAYVVVVNNSPNSIFDINEKGTKQFICTTTKYENVIRVDRFVNSVGQVTIAEKKFVISKTENRRVFIDITTDGANMYYLTY